MADAPQYPAGWYADPENPTVHRWWDGYRWTEARQPAYGQQQAPAPSQPAATVLPPEPVAPVSPAALPTYPVAPGHPAAPGYPAAPAYSSNPAGVVEKQDIPTNTPWIWLVVFLPLLSLASLFLIDWRGYVDGVVTESLAPGVSSQTWVMDWTIGSLGVTLLGYVVVAAQVVFAFLDWRALRNRGVVKPFHWAWIFLALVITNGVYVIGRGIVLRRRTGSGLAPVWAWIAVSVLGVIVGIVFTVSLFNELFAQFAQSGLLTR